SIAYDSVFGSGHYWQDANGNPIANPQQEIVGRDRFSKQSNELRLASPANLPVRLLVGLFQERQTHWIIQDYQIQDFGPQISVPNWKNTIWLTDQERLDKDEAVFAEGSWDVTSQLTLTAGVRGYDYHNSLYGFYGYSAGYNALTGFSSGEGVDNVNCKPGLAFNSAPCVNLNKTVTGSGETHKVNASFRFDSQRMVYFTYSTGYRPGGVNRSGDFGPYQADFLTNYEVGWKTTWFDHSLAFNGAFYDEQWDNFQFSFLGPNSLTIIENAPSATIRGVETSLEWRPTHQLSLSGGAAYNHATLDKNFCGTDQSTGLLIPTCADADAVAVKGQKLPYTPDFKANLTVRYGFDLMGWDAHAQASLLYQDANGVGLRTADIQSLGNMPAYTTADLSFGAEKDRMSLELFIKNAFDTRGQQNRYTPCTVSTCTAEIPGTPKFLYVIPIQPLTVGLRVSQKF
ncbi:MAG TPA: TonB-dependent receptor, partial [Caulobacteraceae bacterium]|nr:TonB-dependent receptor [Caulobacteraceae bacterium]